MFTFHTTLPNTYSGVPLTHIAWLLDHNIYGNISDLIVGRSSFTSDFAWLTEGCKEYW